MILAFGPPAWGAQADQAAAAWKQVPAILAQIKPPKFPHREFSIAKFGAVGDGVTDCTEAFRQAIDECNRDGGGVVVVSGGTFLTGAIHLKSNVDLCVKRGATIRFTADPKGYLPVVFARFEGTEVMNYSPLVYALEQTNIAITGDGTLDGQGTNWHMWASFNEPRRLVQMASQGVPVEQRIFGGGHHLRPNFIVPVRCQNVLIEGVRIVDSPMWVINPVYCTNVTVQNITVETKGPNTDGCDPDSCADVLIRNCDFSDGDDCIAIKSGRDRDGQKINIPSRDFVIQNCHFRAGHGGIGIGSETAGGVRDVFAEDCHFDSPDLEMAIRLKTNPARGGYIEGVYVRNCVVRQAQIGISMTLRYGSSGAMNGDAIPVIRNIDIRNTTFERLTKQPVFIQGWSEAARISDVSIVDCRFLHAAEKNYITNATDIVMDGSRF
ncbi:MAG TPA: glycoside hydrolase family 28 protein [Verrucomicrobiae bacterium]